MPFLIPTVVEFAMVSIDGVPTDLVKTGRFRITDNGESAPSMEVKACEEDQRREPRPEDLEFLKRVMERY